MSKNIDENVVKISFDNKNFESNVKTSMSTLEKFKQALSFKGANKGLNELSTSAKKVDLSVIARGAEETKVKFSALQVVATTALANLTTSAMNAASSLRHMLTDSLVQGGITRALNIQQAQFQLEGLGFKGEKLALVMQNANDAVSGTAYGLDVAAKAASQFAASGIEAGDSMLTALRGISGVAAMTSSSYEDISRIFTSIAGANRVYGNDLLQLSSRGLNVAATLGKTLNKTEGEIREMVSKGEIDFATFARSMNENFGDQAQKANETFTGALSNMKAALSRIGADVASPGLNNLRDIFNSLRVVIDNVHERLKPLIDRINEVQTAAAKAFVEFMDLGGLDAVIDGIGNIFRALWSVIKPIQQAFANIFPTPTVQQVADVAKKFQELTSKLILTDEAAASIQSTFTKAAELIKRFTDALKWGTKSVQDFFVETHILSNAADKVSNALLDIMLGITGGIDASEALTGVVDGLGAGFGVLGRILSLVSNAFGILVSAFSNSVTFINQGMANLTSGVGAGVEGVVELIFRVLSLIPQGVSQVIKSVGQALTDLFDVIPIAEINAAAKDTIFTLIITQVYKFISNINKARDYIFDVFDDIKSVISGVTGVLDGVKSSLQSFAMSIKANALLKIGIAIGLLAVSLKLLSDIPIEQLGLSLAVLSGGLVIMGAAVAGISAIMNKVSKGSKGFLGLNDSMTQLMKVAVSLLIFANAIKVLAEAMQMLSGISWGNILKGLVAIAGLSAVLIAISKLMDSTKGIIKMSASLIIFGFAIKTMASAFEAFNGITWEQMAKGLATLAISLGVLVAAMRLLNGHTKGMLKTSASMIILALALQQLAVGISSFDSISVGSIAKATLAMAALDALMFAISKIKVKITQVIAQIGLMLIVIKSMENLGNLIRNFDEINPESIKKFSVAVISFFGSIMLFMKTLGDKEMRKFLEVSGGMWGIAEGLKVFANAVQMFGQMKTEEIAKGLISVMLGLKTMVGVMATAPEKKIVSTAASFLILAVAVNSLSKSILAFAETDFQSLAKGLGAFIVTMGVLVVAVNSISRQGKQMVAGSASMLLMSIAISALVGPIKTMANIDTNDLAKSLIALASALLIVGVAAKTLGNMGAQILKTAGSLAVMGASLIVFGVGLTAVIYPIKSLGNMDMAQVGSGIAGIAAVLVSLFALTNTINKLPSLSVKTVAKLALLTIVIGAIGAILGNLAAIDAMSALIASTAISEVILSTGITLAALSAIPLVGAIKALATMGVVIGGVAGIVAAAGGLAQIPGAKWLINEGASFLQSIGTALGGFIGGIVGGIAGGALAAIGQVLPGFGSQLSSFAIAAAPFFSAMNGINSGALEGAKSLAEMILILTATSVLDRLTSWLTGGADFVSLAEQLTPFGEAMMEYSNTIQGLDAEAVTNSANAGKALAELIDALPETGGLMQDIMGTHSLVEFTEQLVPFGKALNEYADSIAGINPEAVTNSANAGKAIAELIDSLPSTGGLLQDLMGTKDLAEFTENLVPFGFAMSLYSASISGVNTEAVTNSATAGKALAELVNALPETGGLLQDITGAHDLAEFTKNLVPFGFAMSTYSAAISGVNPESVIASATAGKSLAELAQNLPETGGLIQAFTGEHSFVTLINELIPFGIAMRAYSSAITGINPEAITASATAGQALVSLVESFPKDGGIFNAIETLFNGETNISSIVTSLVPFGTAMKAYSIAITGMDSGAVEASANAGQALARLANELPKEDGWLQALGGSPKDMASFAQDIIPFGFGMKMYSMAISGMDSGAVQASADAGAALANLARSLPTEGGLFDNIKNIFVGESNIVSFMDDMIPFAKGMKKYARAIVGLDSGAVQASADAGAALANLAKNLPTEGGWWDESPITLAQFGEEVASFGPKYKEYYEAVQDIESGTISSTSDALGMIIDRCKNLEEGLGEKISGFTWALPDLGSNFASYYESIKEIAPDIVQQTSDALSAVIDLCQKIPEQVNSGPLNEFVEALRSAGTDGITAFINAITENQGSVIQTISDLCDAIVSAVNDFKQHTALDAFKKFGEESDTNYADGIKDKTDSVRQAIQQMIVDAVSKVGNEIWRFEDAGRYSAEGYARGIRNNIYQVRDAAYEMAKAAVDKVKETTEQASPSKLYMRIARYDVLGYAKGYKKYGYLAERSASTMASEVVTALMTSINMASAMAEEELEFTPKITPVIDLSEAKKEASACNSLIRNSSISIGTSRVMASKAIVSRTGVENVDSSGMESSSVINFTQNNYSPKPLSRIDIYRDTKNQLSRLKGANK